MDINELMELSRDLVVPVSVPAILAINELLNGIHEGLDAGHMTVTGEHPDGEVANHIKREIEAAVELLKLFVSREASRQMFLMKGAMANETGEEINSDELKEMLSEQNLKNVLVIPTDDIEA